MNHHIEQILADAANIPQDEIEACGRWEQPIQPSDLGELGKAPAEAQALFTLKQRIAREHNILHAETDHTDRSLDTIYRMWFLNLRHGVVDRLAWFTTRAQMQLLGEGLQFLGLRRDWMIVRVPDPDRPEEAAAALGKKGIEIQFRIKPTAQPEEGEDPED